MCVGVSDGAGGCLAHTSHQQKASAFVKCFSQQYAYLKWVKGKTELCIHFFDFIVYCSQHSGAVWRV